MDLDRDSAVDNNEVMRSTAALEGTTAFTSIAQSTFEYDARGLVDNSGTLDLCDNRTGETGRRIAITASGRVNIDTLTCS